MRAKAAAMLFLAAASACGRPSASASPSASAPASALASASAPHQPFVLAIVVDQLSAWVAASRWPELPKDGGFARLIREGTWIKTMRYPYAVTDTAPGHAALHTGHVPAESGIFGNEIPDAHGTRVTVLRDDTVKPVLPGGPKPGAGSSAARLQVDAVSDRLRTARPDALVVSISVKDRGAILPGGKHPTHALWYDSWQDSFVTSTAFTDTYPAWAIGVGDQKSVILARAKPWTLTDPAWVKSHAATPDDQPGEGNLDGLGTTFPHVGKTGNAFRGMPAGDAMIAQLGLAAIEAEWDPAKPTLLLLSFSASDVIGHVFGPDSWEAWDHLLKLDAVLGNLLDALERKTGGLDGVLLSADHGNISMPEVPPARAGVVCEKDPYERPCTPGVRLEPNPLRDELIAATKAALGGGSWIAGFADPYVFLTPAARALPDDKRALLDKTIRATFAKHPGAAEVLDVRMLGATCPALLGKAAGIPARARLGEDTLTLVCRSWSPSIGAGEYYVLTKPGSFFDGELVPGKGTSHGTPFPYDRTVSTLVRAPGKIDAGAVIDEPVDFTAYSALEAAFVGLDARAPRDILNALRAK